MKAAEAKVISDNYKRIKETCEKEMSSIYLNIKEYAMKGIVAYHYYGVWLNSNSADNVLIEKLICKQLEEDGYELTKCYNNPNKPYLIISWMKV